MNNASLLLTAYAVNAIWQVPLIGAAGWGLARWLRRLGPELPHKIWVAVLIMTTLAPATPIFQRYFAHEVPTGQAIVAAAPAAAPLAGRHVPLPGFQLLLHPTAIYLACGLYLAVLVFFCARLGWLMYCTAALVRKAGPVCLEPDYLAMWDRSKESFFIRTASLQRSGDVSGPVTAGLWRPVLLLPATFAEEHSRTEFLAAIGHECAHIQRNDFRKNLFYEVTGLLTAFHPLTWFIKSQIAQTREMVCDRMAAERLLDRRTYGDSLLQLALKMPAAAPAAALYTVGMFDAHILERRIMTLMTSMPRVNKIRRYSLGVTAMVLLSVCAGGSGLFTQPVAAQTAPVSSQTVSKDKKQASSKDLTCTYYDKAVAYPGTCGYDHQDKTKYRCYSDQDEKKSQPQTGCEWKLKRAEGDKQ